jgi:hypothetical protein
MMCWLHILVDDASRSGSHESRMESAFEKPMIELASYSCEFVVIIEGI